MNVFAGQHWVGSLTKNASYRLVFAYAPHWLANDDAIPLAPQLPLSRQVFDSDPVETFFQNLLPEGNALDFIEKAWHISAGNTFGLLERFGGDTAGAFSILPEGMHPSPKSQYLPVTPDDIKLWFVRSRGIPLPYSGEVVRQALPGAQNKMAVFIDSQGLMSIPLGSAPSNHIIKASILPQIAINEAMIMKLAQQIGLGVAKVHYDPELDALIIRRHDRESDPDDALRRLHQLDICQLLGVPSYKKYEADGGPSLQSCFAAVLSRSLQPENDKRRLIEWVVFNVLVGNRDGHAKNLSVMTTAEGTQLAPFYDLLCTAVYPHLTQKFALKIGGENRSRWLMARHWERFAVEIGIDTQFIAKTQINIMNRIESALPLVIEDLVDIRNDPAGRAMIDKIHDVIMQSIEQMRSKLSDQQESDA